MNIEIKKLDNYNKTILLTPNEGLSLQHKEELYESGISADYFVKDGGSIFAQSSVQIIDIHKLQTQDKMGKSTVSLLAGIGIGVFSSYLWITQCPVADEIQTEKKGVSKKAPVPRYPNAVVSFKYGKLGGKVTGKVAVVKNHTETTGKPETRRYLGNFPTYDGFRLSYQILLSNLIEHGEVSAADKEENLLEGEMILDRFRWAFLNELELGHYYDLEFITIYGIKLTILERYHVLDSPAGEELFEQIKNIEIPAIN